VSCKDFESDLIYYVGISVLLKIDLVPVVVVMFCFVWY